jgi:hypothetical protein
MPEAKDNATKMVLAKVNELDDAIKLLVASLDESDFADQSVAESKNKEAAAETEAPAETPAPEADEEPADATEPEEEESPATEVKTASEADKGGVEESITQDKFHAVDDLRKSKGEQPQDANHALDVAPTGFAIGKKYAGMQLREAVERLDRVANHCESTGNVKLAYALDKIADALESKVASIEQEGK